MTTEIFNIVESLIPAMGSGFSRKIPLKRVNYSFFFYKSGHDIRHIIYCHFYTRDDIEFAYIAISDLPMDETIKRCDIYLQQFKVSVDVQRFFGKLVHWQEYSRNKGNQYHGFLCGKYQIDSREFEIYFHSLFKDDSNE